MFGATHSGEEVNCLPAGEVGPQRDVPGHVGDEPMEIDGVDPRVAAKELHRAGVGAQQAQKYPNGGGLSRAVGAEEARHLAVGDRKIEPVERLGLPE